MAKRTGGRWGHVVYRGKTARLQAFVTPALSDDIEAAEERTGLPRSEIVQHCLTTRTRVQDVTAETFDRARRSQQ